MCDVICFCHLYVSFLFVMLEHRVACFAFVCLQFTPVGTLRHHIPVALTGCRPLVDLAGSDFACESAYVKLQFLNILLFYINLFFLLLFFKRI